MAEEFLLRMTQSGQIRKKLNEEELIEFLGQMNAQTKKETKIVVRGCLWLLCSRCGAVQPPRHGGR